MSDPYATIDATIAEMERLRARVAKLEAALMAMLDDWDKFTRYGSPMAKAANERVTFARAAFSETVRP